MEIRDILRKVEIGWKTGSSWTARCPAHQDRKASLSISVGDNGGVVLHCHAGCTVEAVVAKLGLTMRDLMPSDNGNGSQHGSQHGAGKPEISTTYDYRDEHGELLYQVVRMIPKGFLQRRPKAGGGWEWKIGNVRRVLYRLPELISTPAETTIFVVEGEKDVDNLVRRGLVATCNSGGADSGKGEKWLRDFAQFFRGRRVVVLPDNDPSGHTHAQHVATGLQGIAAGIKVVDLPGLPPKGDVSDWLDAGGTVEELLRLVEAAPEWQGTTNDTHQANGTDHGDTKPSQSTLLVNLALAAGVDLWHTPDGDAYASLPVDNHVEHCSVRSRQLRRWLSRLFYKLKKKTPGSQALQDATNVIEGDAVFDRQQHDNAVRVAYHEDDIYIDLADAQWRAVRITTDGWSIVDKPPVRFRRAKAMLPLPEPTLGGSVRALREFVNVVDADWPLVVAWLLAAYRPIGPYPVLCLHGEQGSASQVGTEAEP